MDNIDKLLRDLINGEGGMRPLEDLVLSIYKQEFDGFVNAFDDGSVTIGLKSGTEVTLSAADFERYNKLP